MKQTHKGRSTGTGPFVMLNKWAFESPAYRSLKPHARAILWELIAKYNGTNNGWIALSVRDAAERCSINKDTAATCFQLLEQRGFIELTQEGSFSYKVRHAAEWRLTHQKCDRTGRVPSNAFMKWRPEEPTPPPMA